MVICQMSNHLNIMYVGTLYVHVSLFQYMFYNANSGTVYKAYEKEDMKQRP